MADLQIQAVFRAVDKLTAPIKKMGEQSSRFEKQLSSVGKQGAASFGSLKTALAGAAAFLVASQVSATVREYANLADQTAETALRLGVTNSALQEMRYAGHFAGVSAQEMDAGLQQLNKSMGQMSSAEGGKLLAFLKKADPALANQLRSARNAEEGFAIVTEAMRKLPSAADRAALSAAAFGGAGTNMALVAEMSAEEFAKLRQEAIDTGAVIEDDAAASAAEFNDNVDRLGFTLTGLRNSVLGPLVKALVPIISAVQKWIVANRQLMGVNVTGSVGALVGVIESLGSALGFIISFVLKINALFGGDLIPLILGGVLAFKAITAAIAIYNAVTTFMASVQAAAAVAAGILNAVLFASPIGLVVIAIVALIAVGILLVKHWDKVSAFFKMLWGKIKEYFFAAVNFIKQLILNDPIVRFIMKSWGPIVQFVQSLWASIVGIVEKHIFYIKAGIAALMQFIQPIIDAAGSLVGSLASIGGSGGNVGANSAVIQSNSTTTNRSQVDVNLRGAPAGTQVRQRGRAPGVTVRTAPAR